MNSFQNLPISDRLKQVLSELGYLSLTPIQEQSLPILLKGQDLIGQSKTGSGKTAAFTLPVLEKLERETPDLQRFPKLQALVLCPTRELCLQVMREIRKLGRKHIGLKVIPLTGGQPIGPQIAALELGIHIVVGTPGRICDHLRKRTLELSGITTLILDEADRMMEMGFLEEMEMIFSELPGERQTLLFSATFPEKIERLSQKIQKNPVRVTIEEAPLTQTQIIQKAYQVHPFADDTYDFTDRFKMVLHCLRELEPKSCMIFVNFKADAAELCRELLRFGASAGALHGDLEQAERDSVMAKFRNQSLRILIATDVAARGIDVDDLDAVINFDLPQKPEIYVHRIGRTGRAGKTGTAVSIYLEKQSNKLDFLETATGTPIERINSIDLKEQSIPDLGRGLDLKSDKVTLFLAAGRKNKMRPGDILGALTGEGCGIDGSEIGKIEIQDFISFVAVSKKVAARALKGLQDGRIKGRRVRAEYAR